MNCKKQLYSDAVMSPTTSILRNYLSSKLQPLSGAQKEESEKSKHYSYYY